MIYTEHEYSKEKCFSLFGYFVGILESLREGNIRAKYLKFETTTTDSFVT